MRPCARRPPVAVLAGGVVLSIGYYCPYLALALQDDLPRPARLIPAGSLEPSRLLDLLWPSLTILPYSETYLGRVALNVCEASAVEVMPLALLLVTAVASGRVRTALWRALAGMPATVAALVVLMAWMVLPLPSFFGTATLLRWTPAVRAWFVFGIGAGAPHHGRPGGAATFAGEGEAGLGWQEAALALVVVSLGVFAASRVAPRAASRARSASSTGVRSCSARSWGSWAWRS